MGTAISNNVPMFMASRCIEALGGSPLFLIGSAVIGDMYRLDQRGTALGIIQAVGLPFSGFLFLISFNLSGEFPGIRVGHSRRW